MNSRANKFRGKAAQVETGLQTDANTVDVYAAQQDIAGLSITLLQCLQRLDVVTNLANATSQSTTDALYKLQAIIKLSGLDLTKVEELAASLKSDSIDKFNAEEDSREGLELLQTGTQAATGMSAIVSIKLFNKGRELVGNSIDRARVLVGSGELLPEVDVTLIGMTQGESKRTSVDIQGKADEMEVTLVALKTAKAAEQQQNG